QHGDGALGLATQPGEPEETLELEGLHEPAEQAGPPTVGRLQPCAEPPSPRDGRAEADELDGPGERSFEGVEAELLGTEPVRYQYGDAGEKDGRAGRSPGPRQGGRSCSASGFTLDRAGEVSLLPAFTHGLAHEARQRHAAKRRQSDEDEGERQRVYATHPEEVAALDELDDDGDRRERAVSGEVD